MRQHACMVTNRLLTVRQVAEILGIREGTVRVWLTKQRLPRVRLGRAVRIPAEAVDDFVSSGMTPARKARPARGVAS